MIFQRKHHTAFFGARQAALDSANNPLESFLFGVTREDRFDAALFHQLIEVFDGAPAASIDAKARNAERVANLNAFFGVLDLAGDFVGVRTKECLVRGKTGETDAFAEGLALELLKINAV